MENGETMVKKFVVHLNYGRMGYKRIHMVVTPDNQRKLFGTAAELGEFLQGREWRYAK